MSENLVVEKLLAQGFEEEAAEGLLKAGRFETVYEGDVVIDLGSTSMDIPIVLQGVLKVVRPDEKGNELFLYYLESGDPCTFSITCGLENPNSTIRIYAETNADLFLIPYETIDQYVATYPAFRSFIFNAYGQRMEEMLHMIDSLAFMRMDERLFNYLLNAKASAGSYSILKTHQQIANELNTSRVVVSRLLKKLENEGKIEIYRNRIDIL